MCIIYASLLNHLGPMRKLQIYRTWQFFLCLPRIEANRPPTGDSGAQLLQPSVAHSVYSHRILQWSSSPLARLFCWRRHATHRRLQLNACFIRAGLLTQPLSSPAVATL